MNDNFVDERRSAETEAGCDILPQSKRTIEMNNIVLKNLNTMVCLLPDLHRHPH